MNRTVGVFKMHLRDKFSWLYLPWMIVGGVFAVSIALASALPETIVSGGLFSIFVYYFLLGIIVPPQTFLYSLGMSIRRTDYFLGTSFAAAVFGAISSLLLLVLAILEHTWLSNWGIGLEFFHLPFVNDVSVPMQFIAYFVLIMFLFFAGLTIASIYRKFGRPGMYVFALLLFFIFAFTPLLISYYDRWERIGQWIIANILSMNVVTLWLVPLIALFALASYGMLRRSTV